MSNIRRGEPGRRRDSSFSSLITQGKNKSGRRTTRLVHVTYVGYLAEMLRHTPPTIRPRHCPVFEEELVYFYAEKPAYRLKRGDEVNSLQAFFPAAIVIDSIKLDSPRHIYPFDTGAACSGKFDYGYSPGIFVEDFSLGVDIASVTRMIEWAFGSLEQYYKSNLKQNIASSVPNHNFTAHSYIRIAGRAVSGDSNSDMRATAIEIAYNRAIQIVNCNATLIFPGAFLEENGIVNKHAFEIIQECGINFHTYDWDPAIPPNEYIDVISKIIWQKIHRPKK